MGRGLDGFFCFFPRLVRFSRLTEAVSKPFGGEIARGKHLFPFRTEPLSLSAPMVLGGQPPGRVGRRRFFYEKAARRAAFSISSVSASSCRCAAGRSCRSWHSPREAFRPSLNPPCPPSGRSAG